MSSFYLARAVGGCAESRKFSSLSCVAWLINRRFCAFAHTTQHMVLGPKHHLEMGLGGI